MTIRLPDRDWQKFLEGACDDLTKSPGLAFAEMTPKKITVEPGVYLITAVERNHEIPYYIGQTGRLRRRLYRNHLMGDPGSNARLKKYLIEAKQCNDADEAKRFIKDNCIARWLEEPDARRRLALEGYLTGWLFPKYGLGRES